MNALDVARVLRDEFANGTTDLSSGEFWFDPTSALGSLLITTPARGRFEVAATLSDDRLILNPRLTDLLTDACPSWAEVFNLVAGRLVIMDARLMVGDTIERLEALRVKVEADGVRSAHATATAVPLATFLSLAGAAMVGAA